MSETYTLADLEAMKAQKYAAGGVSGLGSSWMQVYAGSGEGFMPLGYASEAAWQEMTEEAFTRTVPAMCPHCSRDWHTEPLRRRVADMLRTHRFDPAYKASEDDSPIECVGSDVYGPNRNVHHSGDVITGYGSNDLLGVKQVKTVFDSIITSTLNSVWNVIGGGLSWTMPEFTFDSSSWWDKPPCEPPPAIDVKFGEWPVEPVNAKFSERHKARKAAAAIQPSEWRDHLALPESSGLDVSTLVEGFNNKHNSWKGLVK